MKRVMIRPLDGDAQFGLGRIRDEVLDLLDGLELGYKEVMTDVAYKDLDLGLSVMFC